jgi:predicted DNA binding CopG/RHH family protein
LKKKCKKCDSELYQADDLKWFCLLCLAKEIEERDRENEVSGTWRILESKTKPVTLRLSELDLARAKARARKLGKPYQTLLKEVIHQALSGS